MADRAPTKFCEWLSHNKHFCTFTAREYRYHPRSQRHSDMLSEFIMQDIAAESVMIADNLRRGNLAYAINCSYEFRDGKKKRLDLVLGKPQNGIRENEWGAPVASSFSQIYLACEAKAVMTEHGKAEPRVFSELNDSHQIAHREVGCCSAGIVIVNMADEFLSPTANDRYQIGNEKWTKHRQPRATEKMVNHLLGLPRARQDQFGFDAFGIIVVNCNNQDRCTLVNKEPAPVPNSAEHYDTFLKNIIACVERNFPFS